MFRAHKRKSITLRRDLGLFDATVAGVGIIVGAGIYVLIGAASGHAGNAVWASFIISAVAAILTGLSYAELSSIYTEDSGEYSYVEHNFSKRIAFVTGYLVIFAMIIGGAAVALGFAGYISSLFGVSNILFIALFSILVFSIVNYTGIKQSILLTIGFTILSIIGLIFIIVLAIPRFGSVNYFEFPNGLGVLKASSLIFFAYIGFESVVKLSEETKNPRRNIPLALLLSIGISSLLYILVAFSVISVIPWQELAVSRSPLSDVASVLLGSHAAIFVGLIAILSTGNTVLLELVGVSRMIYAMAKDYDKLNFLTYVNPKTNTPAVSVVLVALLTSLFVLIGNIELVAEFTNFAIFAVFAVINVALIKSRFRNHRKEKFHEPFGIGRLPVLAVLGFLVNIMMILLLERYVIAGGFLIVASGFFVYDFLK